MQRCPDRAGEVGGGLSLEPLDRCLEYVLADLGHLDGRGDDGDVQLLGSASALQSYIKYLKAEIDRYSEFATEINNRVAKLATLFQLPSTGIFATMISADKGCNDFFIRELITRLMDEEVTTAPPFFRNGLVGGLVILAGAPNPAALEATQTLISLILGLESDLTTKFEDAVNSIDNVLKALEDQTFGDDMQPGGTPTETTSNTTFDDGMNPVDASSSKANVPFDP